MTVNYWNKDKKTGTINTKKKRINWNQTLKSSAAKTTKSTKIKKSLQYILLLKKFNNVIDYKNIKLLKAFLTKYGKIRPRRKTRVTVQHQRLISKSIRKARALGIIPFVCDVVL
jgi:small subunit ribosomal protein S18